jgi:UbiD family decarboxylase
MKSMRDFVARGEETGLCKRITAEVDWNLELSHIAKLNEEQSGPALLFENVKDYDTPVITSPPWWTFMKSGPSWVRT